MVAAAHLFLTVFCIIRSSQHMLALQTPSMNKTEQTGSRCLQCEGCTSSLLYLSHVAMKMIAIEATSCDAQTILIIDRPLQIALYPPFPEHHYTAGQSHSSEFQYKDE